MRTRRGAATALALASLCLLTVLTTTGAAATASALPRRAIDRAVAALAPLPGVASGQRYLEGYDDAMRLALLEAAAGNGLSGGSVQAGPATAAATIDHEREAIVPLTVHGPVRREVVARIDAVVIDHHGRWQLTWTTMCLLVELGGQPCPRTPTGVASGAALPTSLGRADLTEGLVDPGPLAALPGGGVLIADDGRNQILQFKDGVLSVVAGDGLEGFSGDGGPAADAELNDPGEMAVGPDDTIYFVDSGNHRIRAIGLDGIITTVAGDGSAGTGAVVGDGDRATTVPLNPSGVAVGPSGPLFISSNSDIVVVADGIISTRVSGGPPDGVDVEVGGSPMAFFPGSLVLNGQGDLIVFAFSPKELFAVSPAGAVTEVAPDYATALAPGPDGTVLVAQHGPSLGHTVGTSSSTLIDFTKISVPGLELSLAPDGVAETSDGTIYVDTDPGDGYTDQVGLYAIHGSTVTPVTVTTPPDATLPALGAPGFPAATYPATVPPALGGGALAACPSMAGVVPFTPGALAEARHLIGYWNTGFSYDLHASDRAWWPGVVSTFTQDEYGGRMSLVTLGPAANDLDAGAVRDACGATVVADSLSVVLGPSPYSRAVEHLFMLDRDGTPLVYFATA